MTEKTTAPTLYILMRNDMESMNAGKAMAQASHASNAFIHANAVTIDRPVLENEFTDAEKATFELIKDWQHETEQGFGTVLVLAVNEKQMNQAVETAKEFGFVAGVVHDPTYPLRDGKTTHFLPVDTCAYVFGDRHNMLLGSVLGNFPLHP